MALELGFVTRPPVFGFLGMGTVMEAVTLSPGLCHVSRSIQKPLAGALH